ASAFSGAASACGTGGQAGRPRRAGDPAGCPAHGQRSTPSRRKRRTGRAPATGPKRDAVGRDAVRRPAAGQWAAGQHPARPAPPPPRPAAPARDVQTPTRRVTPATESPPAMVSMPSSQVLALEASARAAGATGGTVASAGGNAPIQLDLPLGADASSSGGGSE